MPDHDLDQLDAAFREFRTGTIARIMPEGLGAARAAARRRRTTRVRLVIGLAVLAVLGPVTAVLASGSGGPLSSDRPGRTPTNGDPSASSSTQAAEPWPTSRGAVGFCPAPTHVPTAGGISVHTLCNSAVDIPAWPGGDTSCPAGRVVFTGGVYKIDVADVVTLGAIDGQSPGGLLPVVYTSGLGDGTEDLIVQVNCEPSATVLSQVLVLRPTSGGGIQTVGAVVATASPIHWIDDVATLADGDIRVRVGDFPGDPGILQWRTYHWTGSAFTQVAGPTAFPPNRHLTDLSVTASALTFEPASHGTRSGSITVEIHNHGAATVPYSLTVQVPDWARRVAPPSACTTSAAAETGVDQLVCRWTAKAGATRSLTLHFNAAASPDMTGSNVSDAVAIVAIDDGTGVIDVDPDNDSASVAVELR